MTNIEWTDETWNPTVGCSRVSEGCRHCYAERQAFRNAAMGWNRYQDLTKKVGGEIRWTGDVRVVLQALDRPLRWKRPRRIFVNSMSDLFHEALPFEQITAVYGVMAAAPQHTFQVLTKRPRRRLEWAAWIASKGGLGPYIRSDEGRPALRDFYAHGTRTEVYRGQTVRSSKDAWAQVMNAAAIYSDAPLFNVWEGVSVEDQATADERIPLLLKTPAAKRFISYEPALGAIDFSSPAQLHAHDETCGRISDTVCSVRLGLLNWVIVGGESGPGARPFEVGWALRVVKACKRASVPVFVKQMGAHVIDRNDVLATDRPSPDPRMWPEPEEGWDDGPGGNYEELDSGYQGAPVRIRLKDRKGGDPAEWPEALRVREFPGDAV